jgi:hypothetical protein
VRPKWILASVAALVLVLSVGAAVASHVPQVDPETVPPGFLVTHNNVSGFEIAPIARAVRHHRADVFVWHLVAGPNQALGWHTHPGPAIVTVASGTFAYERQVGRECVRTWYTAGNGFMDPGHGHVHRGIAGPQGAHVYTTFILPTGTENQTLPRPAPAVCA